MSGKRRFHSCLAPHAACLFLAFAACNPAKPITRPVRAEPRIKATVVTIQSTIQPANKTFMHSLVIANDLVRSGDEVDTWRLFDLKQDRVTFVNDIARTYRSESLPSLLTKRKRALSAVVPDSMPSAEVSKSGQTLTIRVGGYQRILSIAQPGPIPPQLFAMMHASEEVTSPLAGIMRAADEALLKVRGFPMTDHAELPYGNVKLVIDQNVVGVEERNVPRAWLTLRSDYRDVTEPDASHRPASSPPPDRTTPAAGSSMVSPRLTPSCSRAVARTSRWR
jgi:hypothetical protein